MSSLDEEQAFLGLMNHYGLTEEHYDQQVEDIHLEELSRSGCKQWKSLPPHLEVETIVADDIDNSREDPGTKRYKFLLKWKNMKGFDATYRPIINALLKIECRQDAQKLCEMLKKCVTQPQFPTTTAGASSHHAGQQPVTTADALCHQVTTADASSHQIATADASSCQLPVATADALSHHTGQLPVTTDALSHHTGQLPVTTNALSHHTGQLPVATDALSHHTGQLPVTTDALSQGRLPVAIAEASSYRAGQLSIAMASASSHHAGSILFTYIHTSDPFPTTY